MRRLGRHTKVVERLHGLGKLHTRAGDLVAKVGYSIQVRQEFIGGIKGQKDWWGTLSLIDKKRVGVGEYTLELEDGRKGNIIINRISSEGFISFEGSGPLE